MRPPFLPRTAGIGLALILTHAPIAIGADLARAATARETQQRPAPAVEKPPPHVRVPHDDGPASAGSAAVASGSPSGVSYDRARAALRDLLATGGFERDEKKAWMRDLERSIHAWVERLFQRFTGQRLPTDTLGRLLAWTLALTALAVLGLWLRRLRRTAGAAARLIDARVPRLTSREWVARARAALAAGDARDAIRCAYHAALFRFEEQGLWTVDDTRTPREYLALLPAGDGRRAALAALTRDFELAWYGSHAYDATGLLDRLEAFGCALPPESRN